MATEEECRCAVPGTHYGLCEDINMKWEPRTVVVSYRAEGTIKDSILRLYKHIDAQGLKDKWEGTINFGHIDVTCGWADEDEEKELMERVERAYWWAVEKYGVDHLTNNTEYQHIEYKEEGK